MPDLLLISTAPVKVVPEHTTAVGGCSAAEGSQPSAALYVGFHAEIKANYSRACPCTMGSMEDSTAHTWKGFMALLQRGNEALELEHRFSFGPGCCFAIPQSPPYPQRCCRACGVPWPPRRSCAAVRTPLHTDPR